MASRTDSAGLRFKDKVLIVTGGCNGIGKGCVDVFLENGAKVAILDIKDIDELTGKSITADPCEDVFFIKCDVSKEDEVKSAVESAVAKFGRLDCLINNAGIHMAPRPIDDISLDDFQRIINVNVFGFFLMSKYCLPHIRKTKGSVVNIASISAHGGAVGAPTYTASKGAVLSMTKTLAIDEAKIGVRINSVSPGMIVTSLFEKSLKEEKTEHLRETFKDYTLLRRLGQPREVGQTCLYLASDATYCTGTDITVTAGIEVGLGPKSIYL